MTTVDLDTCAEEPIHIPGSVQPHGALFVCRETDLQILQASRSATRHTGRRVEELLGRPMSELLAAPDFERLEQAFRAPVLRAVNPLRVMCTTGRELDAVLHRPPNRDGTVIIELEPVPPERGGTMFDPSLRERIVRLQGGHDVASLTEIAADEMRALTGFDRVMVYRFDADWNGEVIAENKRADLDSFLGQHYPASDIPAQARRLYELNWLRLIADVGYTPSPLVALPPAPEAPVDMSFAMLRSVSPIHIEYLQNMGVTASMSISLLRDGRLAGLIACHHYSGPRLLPFATRETAEYLGQALSWSLSVLETAAVAKNTQQVQAAEAEIVSAMATRTDLLEGLATDALVRLANAQGAAVVLVDGARRLGVTPENDRIRDVVKFLGTLGQDVFATDKLSDHLPSAIEWESTAAGLLAVAISRELGEYLLWFRPSSERTIDWGGNPNHVKLTQREGEAPRLSPRGSFALWREVVQGRSLPWMPWEIEGASSLRRVLLGGVRRRAAELREVNERLIEVDRAKDDFITSVSHELRTPLNAITGWANILRKGGVAPDRVEHALDVIARNADAQARLVEDLIDVSRIRNGKLRLDVEQVDLPALLEKAAESMSLAVDARSITLTTDFDRGASPVLGDPARLQQVVNNLLTNAVKFTPQGGTIRVSLRRDGNDVEIAVADSGKGISASFLPKVFDAFRQEDGGMNRRSQGLGLGLAIVRKLIDLHGGRVSVESEGEGLGATFRVRLPFAPRRITSEPHLVDDTATEKATEAAELSGARILVIEDEPDAREFTQFVLERAGAHVTLAEDAIEATARLDADAAFDAIVSDIGLPLTNGIDLMRQIRARPADRGGRIPAVALTAYTRAIDRTRSIQAGFQAHVPKPVDPTELIAVIASLLHRP